MLARRARRDGGSRKGPTALRIIYPLLWSRPTREVSGAQSVATAAALAAQGAEVTLLLPRAPGDPALDAEALRAWFGVKGDFAVVQRPSRWAGTFFLRTALWARQLFRDPLVAEADILYSRIPYMFFGGGGTPIPFAVEHYRPWPDELPWLRPLIRRTATEPHCRGFILHSDYAAQSYRRAGVDPARLLVAHNGVDPALFEGRLERTQARAKLGLRADRPIAVYSGSLKPEKAIDQILALAGLRPDVLFLLVGSEGEGPIEAEAARHPNVTVLPWQVPDVVSAYLQAADVLLIPASTRPLLRSRTSVLPIKTFSYLAAGRPILAPRAPDTAELLKDGENATLVEPDRPDLAAAALDRLLGDRVYAAALAEGALRTARTLTWEERAKRILAFLSRR
jgi:glycosyltransferase involved in cell wall biosynthesis